MEVEFAMRVSYLELYNEELCDLLSSDDSVKIRIFDDVNKKGSVIVQGLEEIPVRCKSDVYRLLAKGQDRRRTAATLMNAQSSRSHTVFSILVHIKENGNDGEEMLKIGKLNLVDLAGSENISKAGNEKGIRTRESVNINQSLLTLGRVITALVERTPHIPYRESKLTRLLQESLGGRTKTSIIATVSPGHKDLEETLSTLDYAHRAKHIQNKPEINQRLTKKVVLKEYSEEIDRLKRDLMAAREKNGIYLASDTYNDMLYKMEIQQKELNEKITVMKTLKEDLSDKNRMFEECSQNLEIVSSHLVSEQSKVRITEAELSKTKRNLRKVERHHEEKKHIVMCHQKTEEALTEHAKQLIEVADEASGDTYNLIESINRRKEVEEKAVTASDQLMKNLNNNIIEMRHEMEQLKLKHKESTKLVVADLEENTKMNKQFTKSILSGLKELKDLRDNSGAEIQNIVGEWTKLTGDVSETDSKKSISWMCEMEHQQMIFHSIIGEKIRAMELLLAKEKTENEGTRAQLLEKINEQNAAIEIFCGELKEKIEKHSQEFMRMSSMTKQQTDAQKAKLQEIKRLLMEVEELDCGLIQEEMSALNDDLLSVGTEKIKAFGERNSSILGEKIGCLKNVEDSQAEMCGKLTEHLASSAKTVEDEDEKMKLILKQQIDLEAENEARFKAQLSAVEKSVAEKVKDAGVIDGLKCDGITHQLKSENSRALVKAQEVKSLVQHTLTGLVQGAESTVCDKLLKCSANIDAFQQEDVLKYKSTGETPARKDFKFNKNLIATSPHERIIKRLRMETGLSDSSQQLDASLIEVRKINNQLRLLL
jgi:kinesin family member 11